MKNSILFLSLALASCGGGESADGSKASGPHPLEARYLAAAPTDAVEVSQLRGLGDGAEVVVRGDVQDFAPVEGRAVLVLFDHALLSCDEMGEDDHCATPWDFCCEDMDKITLGSAMVEFRGEDGQLVAADLGGFHGIDHLTDVVVSGTLALDDAGNARVVASGIHVE